MREYGPASYFRRMTRPKLPKINWRYALGELSIVVVGILIAVSLNAAWGNRQDTAREQAYLQQLAADLDLTADRLTNSIRYMDDTIAASRKVLMAFVEPANANSDSVVQWVALSTWYNIPGLSFGVARGLASGEIAVITDDSLQAAVLQLIDNAETQENYDRETYRTFVDYTNQLRQWAPYAERLATDIVGADSTYLRGYYPNPPFGPDRRVAFSLDVDSFLRDRSAYVVVDGLYDMGADIRNGQSRLLGRVRDVQGVLERRGIVAETEEAMTEPILR